MCVHQAQQQKLQASTLNRAFQIITSFVTSHGCKETDRASEREKERETERDRERQRQRDRDRERDRERQRETETERQRDTDRDRDRDRETERHTHTLASLIALLRRPDEVRSCSP